MTQFRPILDRLAETFLPPEQRAGADEAALRRVEDALGVRLPALLRDFYAIAAGRRALMDAHYHFRPLDALEVLDGRIVFCDENQGNYFWGVPVEGAEGANRPDPPADVRHRGETEWHMDSSSACELLIHFTWWQMINAMPASARFSYGRKLKDVLPRTVTDVCPRGIAYHMRSYADFERRILVSAFLDEKKAYVAANRDEDLEAFESESGVDLDWL